MRPVERPEWLGTPAGDGDVVPLFVSWEMEKDFIAQQSQPFRIPPIALALDNGLTDG